MLMLQNLMSNHNRLRHPEILDSMMDFVVRGGVFDRATLEQFAAVNGCRIAPLVHITRFEDGLLMVHDGHHRAVACCLGARPYLHDEEYYIEDDTYESYLEISHHNGWYTPFDPRTHVRLPDFGVFKHEARDRFNNGESDVEAWVRENHHRYRVVRELTFIHELANLYRFRSTNA